MILLHLSLHLLFEGRSEAQLRADLYLKRSELLELIFVACLVVGTHIGTDDFFYSGQAAADIAIEEQKFITVSLPDLPNLLHHVYLDLGQFRSESGVLIPHFLPHSLHMPNLFILLLHQQFMKLLVKLTNTVNNIWKFLLSSTEVVMTVIDQPVNLCNPTLNETHASDLFLLELAVGAVEGDHFVFLVEAVLVHAGHAEWFFIADAVESSHVVVLEAPLETFRVEDGGLQLDGTLDLLPEALDEGCKSGYLELLEGLQLHCVEFFEEVFGGRVEVFVGGAVVFAVPAEAGLASRSRMTHIITNSQVIISKQGIKGPGPRTQKLGSDVR